MLVFCAELFLQPQHVLHIKHCLFQLQNAITALVTLHVNLSVLFDSTRTVSTVDTEERNINLQISDH